MPTETKIESTTTVESSTEVKTNQELGVLGLIKYIFNSVFKSLFFGRASRGEYVLSTLMLSIAAVLAAIILSPLGKFGEIVGWIVLLMLFLFALDINVSRAHDLERSPWFLFPIIIAPIALVIGQVGVIFMFSAGSSAISSYGPFALIVGGLFAIRSLVVSIFLYFIKGTVGDNKYGPDRLSQQPSDNKTYWIAGAILFVALVVIQYLASNIIR